MKHPATPVTGPHADDHDVLFARLETALRCHGHLLPTNDDQLRVSELAEPTKNTLPNTLADPEDVLRRGQQLLRNPPELRLADLGEERTLVALMEAARNGDSISQEVRRIMHEDRRRSEQEQALSDVSSK